MDFFGNGKKLVVGKDQDLEEGGRTRKRRMGGETEQMKEIEKKGSKERRKDREKRERGIIEGEERERFINRITLPNY